MSSIVFYPLMDLHILRTFHCFVSNAVVNELTPTTFLISLLHLTSRRLNGRFTSLGYLLSSVCSSSIVLSWNFPSPYIQVYLCERIQINRKKFNEIPMLVK